MRPVLVILAVVIFGCPGCGEGGAAPGPAATNGGGRQTTTIQWIDSARNFGKILEGQQLAVSFRFRNTGSKPLVIESVTPSCGCTVAEYPKEPIAPGAEAEITGAFDSNGREGLQHKEITVTSNTPELSHRVYFEVTVTPKKKRIRRDAGHAALMQISSTSNQSIIQ